MDERVYFDARRHSVVLVRPLGRAVAIAIAGIVALALPWPLAAAGAILLVIAAALALAAVVRWDRTRFVVTTEKVFLVQGVTRRRASAVMFGSMRIVALEQTLPGRVLGYGTLYAGPLEVEYVPHAARVRDMVEHLAA